MDRFPKVITIVLNWNGLEDTRECLESLSKLDYPNHEVIVVDNGSTDESVFTIRNTFPAVILVENPDNLGFTGGNNVGIRTAMERGAEYLWLLNNDTTVEAGALRKLVRAGEGSPSTGLLSPIIYFQEPPGKIQFMGNYIHKNRNEIRNIDRIEQLKEEYVQKNLILWGTALLIKRGTIERIGLLNEKYFAYYEDEEYGLRATKAGIRSMMVPGAEVYHKNSRSTGSYTSPLQAFLRSRNLYFLWMDHVTGLGKIRCLGRILGQTITYGAYLRENRFEESVDACLDGFWCAFKGEGGPRNRDRHIPLVAKRIFTGVFFLHPYFWSCLLRGDIRKILSKFTDRFIVSRT